MENKMKKTCCFGLILLVLLSFNCTTSCSGNNSSSEQKNNSQNNQTSSNQNIYNQNNINNIISNQNNTNQNKDNENKNNNPENTDDNKENNNIQNNINQSNININNNSSDFDYTKCVTPSDYNTSEEGSPIWIREKGYIARKPCHSNSFKVGYDISYGLLLLYDRDNPCEGYDENC